MEHQTQLSRHNKFISAENITILSVSSDVECISIYLSIYLYISLYIYIEYNLMETQTRLSRHNKFISAENITILSVSSDDYLHVSLSSQSSKCGVTVCIQRKINKEIKIKE